jgi:hypothetical protein
MTLSLKKAFGVPEWWPRREALSSQPISVHGVGTVRHWAAAKLSIVQCRHNVSARDGGIPASRKGFGRVPPGQRAWPTLPKNAPPATFIVHSKSHLIRPADAAVLAAGGLPPLHGSAPAAGLTSLFESVSLTPMRPVGAGLHAIHQYERSFIFRALHPYTSPSLMQAKASYGRLRQAMFRKFFIPSFHQFCSFCQKILYFMRGPIQSSGVANHRTIILPLPAGEGRGEGEPIKIKSNQKN